MKETLINTLIVPPSRNADKFTMELLLLDYGAGSQWELDPHYEVKEFAKGMLPKGVMPDDLEAEGALMLDCGGKPGRFNGHCREEKISGTLLVAQALKIDQDPELVHLVKVIDKQDNKGRLHMDMVPSIVQHAYDVGYSVDEVRSWFFEVIRTIINKNKALLAEGKKINPNGYHCLRMSALRKVLCEYDKHDLCAWAEKVLREYYALQAEGAEIVKAHAVWDTIQTDKFGPIKVGLCEDFGNPTVKGNLHNAGADVAICRTRVNGKLNTCIGVGKQAKAKRLGLWKVVKNLRYKEAVKGGLKGFRNLSCEGTHPMIHEWHVLEGSNCAMIFNGTKHQHVDVRETKLSQEELLDCVYAGVAGNTLSGSVKSEGVRWENSRRNEGSKKGHRHFSKKGHPSHNGKGHHPGSTQSNQKGIKTPVAPVLEKAQASSEAE